MCLYAPRLASRCQCECGRYSSGGPAQRPPRRRGAPGEAAKWLSGLDGADDAGRVAVWHELNFQNSYGQTVWVGIERYNCNGWENQGWYAVSPGHTVTAFSTTNRYAYFYAQAENGAYWAGNYEGITDDYYPWYSPGYDYGGCSNIGSTAETPVGMRQIDLGGWNLFEGSYTINLVP